MIDIFRLLRPVILRFAMLLFLYTALRILFYFFHHALFPEINAREWLPIVLQGIRFDIAALLYLNALPILLQSLPLSFQHNKTFEVMLKSLFIVFNLIGFVLILTDFAFYPFNLKRLDSELLGLLGAVPTMMSSFISDYWYLFILFIGLIYLLLKIFKYTATPVRKESISTLKSAVAFILLAGFIFLGIRGGVQSRPIRPVMATKNLRVELAPLVTNSPFTFFYSILNRRLESKQFFSKEKANAIFPIKKTMLKNQSEVSSKKPNVVMLILESFSASCIGFLGAQTSYTPFLDSLSNESLIFTRAFANGRRSSQGLVALTAGLPALMDDPYMYSPYLNNRIFGLPTLLEKMGYQSSFFNGSDKSMLGWEEYINSVGFDQYFSRESYPQPDHYDGHWGIYNHYFLNYFLAEARQFKPPFFSTFFTLSSHHPFHIPKELKKQFSSTETPYYNSLMYTDWALRQFFEKAKQESWFNNTVFLITADHTLYAADKSPENEYTVNQQKINRVSLYHIPIMIYAPELIQAGRREKVVQQLDLFDTALELAGYEGAYYSFGNSVLSENEGQAFQQVKGIYQFIEGDYLLLMKDDECLALYNHKLDADLLNDIHANEAEKTLDMCNKLKAIIQQHNNTLIEDNMRL